MTPDDLLRMSDSDLLEAFAFTDTVLLEETMVVARRMMRPYTACLIAKELGFRLGVKEARAETPVTVIEKPDVAFENMARELRHLRKAHAESQRKGQRRAANIIGLLDQGDKLRHEIKRLTKAMLSIRKVALRAAVEEGVTDYIEQLEHADKQLDIVADIVERTVPRAIETREPGFKPGCGCNCDPCVKTARAT